MYRAITFTFWILLCLNSSVSQPEVPLKELMVLTVVDFSNPAIIRDCLTMIRSLRLLGQNFSSAQITLAVPIDNKLVEQDFTRISDFLYLENVEIHFTQRIDEDRFAKTMNKLNAFKLLDSQRNSHVLWLDADIIVLGDPTEYLMSHHYPGRVDCVPDFYSYMRRYPDINTTSQFWNPSLPLTRLLGEDELSSSGLCNTGVMLFDSIALQKVVRAMESAINNHVVPPRHLRDRFADSLLLVYAINNQSIETNIWPQVMNYMAFFEGEILAEFPRDDREVSDIVFAHMLWETEFYCNGTTSDCQCVYKNEHLSSESILYPKLKQIGDSFELCAGLAGIDSRRESANDDIFVQLNGSGDLPAEFGGNECALLWPPRELSIRLIGLNEAVDVSILLVCGPQVGGRMVEKKFHVKVAIYDAHSREEFAPSSDLVMEAVNESRAGNKGFVLASSLRIVFAHLSSPVQELGLMISFCTQYGEDATAMVCTEHYRQDVKPFSSIMSVLSEHLVSNGHYRYHHSYLTSLKSTIVLPSQLQYIPHYVKSHVNRDSLYNGVVVCCQTDKGVQTVRLLIHSLAADLDTIVIVMADAPQFEGEGVVRTYDWLHSKAIKYFSEACRSIPRDNHRKGCVIVPLNRSDEVVRFVERLSFVNRTAFSYMDYYDTMPIDFNERVMRSLYAKLRNGGIVVGSRYVTWHNFEEPAANTHDTKNAMSLNFEEYYLEDELMLRNIRNSVEKFSRSEQQVAMQTTEEFLNEFCLSDLSKHCSDGFCRNRKLSHECLPAWYMVKMSK